MTKVVRITRLPALDGSGPPDSFLPPEVVGTVRAALMDDLRFHFECSFEVNDAGAVRRLEPVK